MYNVSCNEFDFKNASFAYCIELRYRFSTVAITSNGHKLQLQIVNDPVAAVCVCGHPVSKGLLLKHRNRDS